MGFRHGLARRQREMNECAGGSIYIWETGPEGTGPGSSWESADTYVITLPQSGNHILDIRPVMLLTEEERKAEDFLILGVAEGYGEACEVVRTMVDDMYRHTDGFNWKSYMAYLGEAR